MHAFFTGLFSVLLAMFMARDAFGAPSPMYTKHSTRRFTTIGRDVQIETYHPKSSYATYGEGKEAPSFSNEDLNMSTISFIASELGIDSSAIAYRSGRSAENGMSYAYVTQYHDGVTFANAVANVAFKNGNAVAFGSSFVDTYNIASSSPSVALESIVPKVEDAFAAPYNGISSLEYLAQSDGSVALTHVVQVMNPEANIAYQVFVDAHSGEILAVTDMSADATYTVVPITSASVAEGQETLVNPEDFLSSPAGWVLSGQTLGNNVISYKGSSTNTTIESSPETFDYPYDVTVGPAEGSNIDAARTNAFYVINKIHDFTYKYGWTESAYNYQISNFGRGGAEGDPLFISVQDTFGMNNAYFYVTPDGQPGLCQMFIFDYTIPYRDGAMQNDLIVHEYTHGLSNRLTGGGTATCLQTTESSGLGEGWSDAMAEWTEQTSGNITDYVLFAWAINNPSGARDYPYSTDPSVNPLRYSSIRELSSTHDIGEVWANMLHNVYAALVEVHGWSSTAMEDASGLEGNIVYLHLFIDALALQPCNPTFICARDAWIQADMNRYNGDNSCILWNVFASRGLGVYADNYVDDENVPDNCRA
ncbi:Fungalysin metallopeptidase-domain-containing protein [Desarmillaria tabescens]|uniref:Extracellular metalloproteinase n=1 Tax=Armillaria tabescens TaxID=1929756 RepID=A0AA39MMR8_ARMTA|nr:Fungalysin metallopeptidase-domain-containing protein [Desarmillaria tabescens]KAK0439982.1 Fungalysin metallopeptidase-domain-containing protein [Desarmillaria tabescens]